MTDLLPVSCRTCGLELARVTPEGLYSMGVNTTGVSVRAQRIELTCPHCKQVRWVYARKLRG